MLISEEYRQLNAAMHQQSAAYGSTRPQWVKLAEGVILNYAPRTVLDYGCGKGRMGEALIERFPAGVEFIGYDPAIPGKEHKPHCADVVICCDVLEHIEPDCLFAVLDDIRAIARLGVMMIVATRAAVKSLPDGRNAHLIVEPSGWWLSKFLDRWRLKTASDLGGAFLFVGEPA